MRIYSAHYRPPGGGETDRPPVLIKEGFSWPCLILGWVGLLLSLSWITALLAGAVSFLLIASLRHLTGGWIVFGAWHVLLALFGNDLRRWELGLHGFTAGPVVTGRNTEGALVRLLDQRPELIGSRT